MSDIAFENPTDELINLLNVQITSLDRRLEEIRGQIDTYRQSVQREEKRNADMDAALRTMYDNFDTIPREDIRSRYDSALDARHRLATMRGQLGQLEASQQQVEEEKELLMDVLERIQGGISISEEDDIQQEGPISSQSFNIVRIVQAQEDERRRLANQMHDGPAQSLTNFVLQAEICQRLFDRNPENAKEELLNLKDSASLTFQRVRDFISDLRPMMLDDLGVIPTVKRYIESFSNKSDISVDEDITGDETRRLEEYQEVMLFRGLQDLMGQARDFADATEIKVRLDIQLDRAVVVVEDNGRGFDVEAMFGEEHVDDPRGQGLQTLREKFELINGNIAITSNENDGTQIRVEMPVSDRT